MDNDSKDRSNIQDNENNDSGEQSPIPVSLERQRNEEKDPLANKKQESQSCVRKRKKKSRNRKVSTCEEDSDSSSSDSSSQAKKKRKPNVGNIINRHRHLPQLPVIQVPTRNRIMIGLKLSLKMKSVNGSFPKVWPTAQTNILKSTFQKIV